MSTIDVNKLLAEARQQRTIQQKKVEVKQTNVQIHNRCVEKFQQTKELIQKLEEKKRKLEDEIAHLQQKQIDRKKFITENQKNLNQK